MREEFKGTGVFIMTCSDCNTKCKHCYVSYRSNFDANELYDLCKVLTQKYGVYLNGTEIVLHPDYFKSIKLVCQHSILTNGLEIHKNSSLIPQLADAGITYIGTSYHFGFHGEISSIDHKIVENNIEPLRKYGIGTDLRVTISSKNYLLVKDMCDKAFAMKARGIKFTNYMHMGNALNLDKSNALTYEQLKTFFTLLEEARNKYSKEDLLIRRCVSFGCSDTSHFHCTACEDAVTITRDLKVYPCFFLIQKGMEIGHVEDGKIIITRKIDTDKSKCLAREINNNNLKL